MTGNLDGFLFSTAYFATFKAQSVDRLEFKVSNKEYVKLKKDNKI